MGRRKSVVLTVLCVAALAWLSACGAQQSAGPKMGSPEWYWAAAREQFAAGDFTKTQEHLEKIMATSNPYKERASVWHLAVLSGMANGYRGLAEVFEEGEKASRKQASDFRRAGAEMRRSSRQFAIGLAEETGRFTREMASAPQFPMDFEFPKGNANEPPTLERVRQGTFLPEADMALAQRQMIAREVVLSTAALAGAPKDPAKAMELFKTPPVQVPRSTFLLALAESLLDESAIFDRKKLNEPDKKKIMLQLAADCLKAGAEGAAADVQKRVKALQARIEKEQKAADKKG